MRTSAPSARSAATVDRLARLAPAHRHAALEQDARQPAHARAGDAHDVHPAERRPAAARRRWPRCAPARRRAPPSRPAARRWRRESGAARSAQAWVLPGWPRRRSTRRYSATDVAGVLGQHVRGVACTGRAAARRHRPHGRRIGDARDHFGSIQAGVRSALSTSSAATGGHDRLGVEALLAAAQGQRHVRGRQTDRGQFGAGHRPAPAHREVRGGVGVVHLVDVGHDHVRRRARRRARRRRSSAR